MYVLYVCSPDSSMYVLYVCTPDSSMYVLYVLLTPLCVLCM